MSERDPSAEALQRELEQVRAASPPIQGEQTPLTVPRALLKGATRPLILWAVLIVMFLAIWQLLEQGK